MGLTLRDVRTPQAQHAMCLTLRISPEPEPCGCSYLERSVAQTLVKLYVSDPTNADEWLADEIYRAACDPGAIGVFQCVPPPPSLSPYE